MMLFNEWSARCLPWNGDLFQPAFSITDEIHKLTVSRFSDRLVYSKKLQDFNLWRIPGPNARDQSEPEKLNDSSTRDEWGPVYSPDGTKLAFVSARTGFWELWLSDPDGSNPRRLTHMSHALLPVWSNDSERIIFSSVGFPEGHNKRDWYTKPRTSSIYELDVAGGIPQQVFHSETDVAFPAWSQDEQFVYYQGDTIDCGWTLMRSKSDGSETTPLATCTLRPLEGPDGRVYFTDTNKGTVSSVNAHDGSDYRVEVEDSYGVFTAWTLWERNIVYLSEDLEVKILDIDSRETNVLANPILPQEAALLMSLAVSPDGKWIAFSKLDRSGIDLMVADSVQ